MINRTLNINIVLSIILLALQLTFIPVFVTHLSMYDYGIFMLYKSASHMGLATLFAFGLNYIVRQIIADSYPEKINLSDILNLILIILITAPIILIGVLFIPIAWGIPKYVICMFAINELFLVYMIAVAEGSRKITHVRIAEIIITSTLIIYLGIVESNLRAILYLLFFANICKSIYIFFIITNLFGCGCNLRIHYFSLGVGYLSISNIFSVLNNNFERYFFGVFIGVETIIYQDLLQKFYKLFKNQIGLLILVLQPYYQKIKDKNSEGEIIYIIAKIFVPISITTTLLSYISVDRIILSWMGPEYIFLSNYIIYTIPALSLFLWNSFYGMVLIVDKKYKTTMKIQSAVTILRIFITLVLIGILSYWIIVLNLYLLFIIAFFMKKDFPKIRLGFLFFLFPTLSILVIYALELLEVRGHLFNFPILNLLVILIVLSILAKNIFSFTNNCKEKFESAYKVDR